MGSETGTVKTTFPPAGSLFPVVNPWLQFVPSSYSTQKIDGIVEVFAAQLVGVSTAISTDDYTYTLFVAPEAYIVRGCFIVDPVGLAVDSTNYNTYQLLKSSTVMCQRTDQYGISQYIPMEITLASTLANHTLAAGDTVSLKITGSSSGKVINNGLWVFVICERT